MKPQQPLTIARRLNGHFSNLSAERHHREDVSLEWSSLGVVDFIGFEIDTIAPSVSSGTEIAGTLGALAVSLTVLGEPFPSRLLRIQTHNGNSGFTHSDGGHRNECSADCEIQTDEHKEQMKRKPTRRMSNLNTPWRRMWGS